MNIQLIKSSRKRFLSSTTTSILATVMSSGTFVIAVALVVLAAGAGTARADPIPGYLPGGVWYVEPGPGVSVQFDNARKPSNTVGTLMVNFTHNNGQAWQVHFRQDYEVPTSGVDGGLRFNLDTTVRNNMTSRWSGYQLELTDDTWPPPNDPHSDSHPPAPHFHPLQPAAGGAGIQATFKPFTEAHGNLPDPATGVLFIHDGGAHVTEVGQDYKGQNLLVHNRHFAIGIIPDPGRREFTLYGGPIVLPSAAVSVDDDVVTAE